MTSRWRPKNRRQILQLDDEGSQSPSIQNSTTPNNPPVAASATANKLHALLGHYNSDDESDKDEEDNEFKDFMNEIKSVEETPTPQVSSVWQELWDPQSGQPYYWHTVTNELTWEKPQDLIKTQLLKPSTGNTKVVSKSTMVSEEKNIPSTAVTKQEPVVAVPKTISTPTVDGPSLPDPPKAVDLGKREDGKVSFKISTVSERNAIKAVTELNQAKTNGRLTIDVDSIIAAIEKEVPPDYKTETFVPLFRRRPAPSEDSRPKLGNDFKKFFPLTHQPALDLEAVPSTPPPAIVNTFKGLGYQEKEDSTTPVISEPITKVQFVAGEILKPMVVVAPVVPLTLTQKITRLENHFDSEEELPPGMSKVPLVAQLEILKEAWSRKKLEADFLDEWLETVDKKLKEKPEIPQVQQGQVIDMVLEDSGSESPRASPTPESSKTATSSKNEEVTECLDSALSSFYTDLASLDTETVETAISIDTAVPSEVPVSVSLPETTPPLAVIAPVVDTANPLDEETNGEPIKGIKRTKMSSDMTSLVAKWQKIYQANTQ